MRLTRLSGDTKPLLPISRLWLMEYMIFNYVDVMKPNKKTSKKTSTYDYHETNNNSSTKYTFVIQCKNMISMQCKQLLVFCQIQNAISLHTRHDQ